MKKLLNSLFIVGYIAMLPMIINLRDDATTETVQVVKAVKPHCVGYTVIEAGKGVDCNGDTIKLIKKYGFYELASRYDETTLNDEALN